MYRLLDHVDQQLRFHLDAEAFTENRFTVVLGPNGTGKSQLLRSIAEVHRLGGARSEERSALLSITALESHPSALLVLSNMVTDVFVNSSKQRDTYRYLGLRQASNNTSTGALRDATAAAILECARRSNVADSLGAVLDTLGGNQFRISFERPSSRVKRPESSIELVRKFLDGLELDQDRSHFASSDALLSELRVLERTRLHDESRFEFDSPEMDSFWSICARFELEAMDLIRLLRRLGFAEVRVHVEMGSRLVDLDSLSTGQLLLLSTFARVAAHIVPNALVVIDEPEAGLHPNWQSNWIPLMRATIPATHGCHFFIATHSPYLVSDADDVLVPGDEWGNFVQFDEPYQGRSVENILYRVFGARVAGNLMVETDLKTLVQLISHNEPVLHPSQREEVQTALQRLRGMQDKDTQQLNDIVAQAEEMLRQ